MNIPDTNKVKDKTVQSVKWTFSLKIVQNIFFFASGIVLARVLVPEDFGLATMAMTVDTISWLIISFGASSVIHYQDKVEERLNASFWFIAVFAILLTSILFIASGQIAVFYKAPLMADIIKLSSIAILINSFGAVQKAILSKSIDFKTISILEASLNTIKNLLYIVLALLGFGVWSFIYPKIIYAIANVFSLWKITKWRPEFKLYLQHWNEMINYSKNVILSGILDYLLNNSAFIIIGGLVGSTTLGIYTFAYDKSMMIVSNITYPIIMIAFPAFSRLQNHTEKLKEGFIKTIKMISLLSFPYTIGQIVLGKEFIMLVFGEKWLPAVYIFQIILIYSMIRAVSQCGNPLLQGIGKPDLILKWNLIFAPIYISCIYTGFVINGLIGIAVMTTLVGALGGLVYLYIISRVLKWSYEELINNFSPALISSLIMGMGVYLVKRLIEVFYNEPIFILITMPVLGIILYFYSLYFIFPTTYQEILGYAKNLTNRKGELKTVENE